MFRDHMINFLEAAVVFLLLTNAVGVLAAVGAMRLLHSFAGARREPTFIERKLGLVLGRTAQGRDGLAVSTFGQRSSEVAR
jgi:hypothetical protein